jgi:hypothetical protein
MTRTLLHAGAFVLALVATAGAVQPGPIPPDSAAAASQASQPPADSPLAPLGFLIGKWEETRLSPPATGARVNHLEMTWDLERSVIRRSEVRSEDGKRWRGTGLIAWNPVSRRIEFQEHADWGNFVRGTIDIVGEQTVRRNMEVWYPDGTTARWRTTVTAPGADEFTTSTEKLVEGEWQVQWALAGKRVSAFPWDVSAAGRPGGYTADNEALEALEPHMGIWGPPPGDEAAGFRTVLEWGIPGESILMSEYRTVDGTLILATQGMIGYHYGRQRIEFLEFARDGLRPYEVMNEGYFERRDDGAVVRRYRSFDPDMSSREYRETYTLQDDGSRVNTIEYRDDEGRWQPWPRGPFRSVRYRTLTERASHGGAGGSSSAHVRDGM